MRTQSFVLVVLLFMGFAAWADAFHLQQIAAVQAPVGIITDGSDRLFLVQQTGQIRIWNGHQLLSRPFLNLSKDISCCGERGLLGLAFHPDYGNNGFFYVDYTAVNGDIVIARFKVSGNPNVAMRSSRRILLTISHSEFGNHNGGQLQFGPDGFLYIGVGDGGSGGDPNNNAQNLGVLLGKILRIDVNSGATYSIPATNPFISNPDAQPEIWDYGLRNPWRFSFDRKTHSLFIADVGQDAREEIDFEKTGHGGKNYGWRRMEGRSCYNPSSNCRIVGLRLPILQYSHADENCAVVGGYRYRGTTIPSLTGTYLYADYCSGDLWGARLRSGGRWNTKLLRHLPFRPSSFGEDATGEIYIANYTNGVILKFVP